MKRPAQKAKAPYTAGSTILTSQKHTHTQKGVTASISRSLNYAIEHPRIRHRVGTPATHLAGDGNQWRRRDRRARAADGPRNEDVPASRPAGQ